MVDLHNHLIPGVDDGANTIEESRDALRAFVDQGFDTIVATPHLQGALTLSPRELETRLAEIDAGWQRLADLARAEFPDVALHRGTELLADTPTPDVANPLLRLAGTDFVLVEFPNMTVPPHSDGFIANLTRRGWRVVLAHPERYYGGSLDFIGAWRRAGAHLQINAGSIVGKYGATPRHLAFEILARGWADYMASDYHARGTLHLAGARALLAETNGEEQSNFLTNTNPRRLLAGETPWPVAPLVRKTGFLERLKSAVRPPL